MGRPMKIEPHVTIEEMKEKLHTADVERQRGKWLVISNALVDPRPAETIAVHTATSLWFVYHTVSDYNRLGPASIEEDGRGGRHHAYLTEAEDVAVLESVRAQAEAGELVTTRSIKQAFEQRVGHEVHPDTITKLLHRHEWDTQLPRRQHPKSNPALQGE